jgi:hypothetical protein
VPPLPAAGEINVILLTDAGCKELRTSSAVKVAPDDPLVRIIRDAGALLQGLLSRRPATGA